MTLVPTYGVIPAMGYGTFKRTGDEALRCVATALEVGYRHFDTAAFYENETEVGKALREGGVARDDLFVTTKVWHDRLSSGQVRASAKESLDRLGMDHVDLLLIHWPASDGTPIESYMEELAQLKADGLTKNIGVSNFTISHIDKAISVVGEGEIATNQCELNVTFQNRPIVAHCHEKHIPMTAYLPLSKGDTTSNEEIARIAKKHDATAAQISLAWLLAKGHIAIPSSSNDERIAENFGALNISLSGGDLEALDALDTGHRKVDVAWSPEWDSYAA